MKETKRSKAGRNKSSLLLVLPALLTGACGGPAHEGPTTSLVLPDVIPYPAEEQLRLREEFAKLNCFPPHAPQECAIPTALKWIGEYIAMREQTRVAEKLLK